MSVSQRVGPLTLNTRGRWSLRIAPGLSFRFGKNSGAGALIALAVVLMVAPVQIAFFLLQALVVAAVWLGRWLCSVSPRLSATPNSGGQSGFRKSRS
jgi:hypothetical protein